MACSLWVRVVNNVSLVQHLGNSVLKAGDRKVSKTGASVSPSSGENRIHLGGFSEETLMDGLLEG